MKIVLHGFGTFAVIFRHVIAAARTVAPEIGWAVVLPTPHYRDLMREVLADDDILSLEDHLSRALEPMRETAELGAYIGNIFADIEAEKRQFKHRPGWKQLARAAEIYRIYKHFLQRVAPTHVLISQVEGFEGKMLASLAKELGLPVLVPIPGRNFGGSYFSAGVSEALPAGRHTSPELFAEARRFLERFRTVGTAPSGLPEQVDASDEQLSDLRKPLMARTLGFVRRSVTRPDLFEIDNLRAGLLNNLPAVRDRWWRLKSAMAERFHDIDDIAELPPRFIYYPLQVSPESSINTPAPYFLDQLRAIDAIRFAMPNDHLLVVKEHPAAISQRPHAFMRALRRRAGVIVIHYRSSSRALIERSACTISVTGTATLEAFLLGQPALSLGPNIISEYLGGVCPLDQLGARIVRAIAQSPDDDSVLQAVAEIFSVRYDFVFRAPGHPDEPVLRRSNIERFLAALLDHIRREA